MCFYWLTLIEQVHPSTGLAGFTCYQAKSKLSNCLIHTDLLKRNPSPNHVVFSCFQLIFQFLLTTVSPIFIAKLDFFFASVTCLMYPAQILNFLFFVWNPAPSMATVLYFFQGTLIKYVSRLFVLSLAIFEKIKILFCLSLLGKTYLMTKNFCLPGLISDPLTICFGKLLFCCNLGLVLNWQQYCECICLQLLVLYFSVSILIYLAF